MSELISVIVEAFTSTVTGLGGGLVEGAETLVYVGAGDSKTLSTLILVVFTLAGFSIGFAIIKWLLGLMKIG